MVDVFANTRHWKKWNEAFNPWLISLAGLLLLYVPSYINLFGGLWRSEQQGHGPIVFGISIWLLVRKWPALFGLSAARIKPIVATLCLLVGLLAYVLGRSQDIPILEIGSIVWVVAAIVLLLRGWSGLKIIGFPLFFMFFMIPLPGVVVDALTAPMKLAVSSASEQILFGLGYPVARSGVVLQIGAYQLLVADACAGLHTLFTLEALGLLYLNVVRYDSLARNVTLSLLIIPISFTANVVRVTALTLITYCWGDEAGQGFLHGFAGMVLFVTALLLIVFVDSLLRLGVNARFCSSTKAAS